MKISKIVLASTLIVTIAACSSSGSSNEWSSTNNLQQQVKNVKQYVVSGNNYEFSGKSYNGGDKVDLSDTSKFSLNQLTTVSAKINGNPGIMKIYNQPYSVVIGVDVGTFEVKDYIGLDTATHGTIPSVGTGTVAYTGFAFSKNQTGTLSYKVNFDTKTGQGEITGLAAHGKVDLNSASISGGTITGTANAAILGGGSYELGFFGPNAEEIAGKATGFGGTTDNDIGFAGKK